MKRSGWLHPDVYAAPSAADVVPGSPLARLTIVAASLVEKDVQDLYTIAIAKWERRNSETRRAGMTPNEQRIDELMERLDRCRAVLANSARDKVGLRLCEALIQQDETELRRLGTAALRKDIGRAT